MEANASKHKALSWEYANRLEAQLRSEVEALLAKAAAAEGKGKSEKDIDIPDEIQRRQVRLARIVEAKAEIKARAKARYEQEQAEYEAKLKARAAKEEAQGRKLGGRKPKAPESTPKASDQVNFTDEDSRIMPVSGGGFEQAYNAQASVDMEAMLIVGAHVSQHPNDKQEVEPALAQLHGLPEELGRVNRAASDSGYFSEKNIKLLEEHGIEPYIVAGRQSHNLTLEERLAPEPEPPQHPDAVSAMMHRLKTEAGKAIYAQRKSTVEPVFGIIKEVMGFRRFMLRGLTAVSGEWTLVCIAFNLKRLCTLRA